MRTWGKALLRETMPAAIGVFSLASTVITFLPRLGLYSIRWVPLICLIGAFAWANLRVFKKQQLTIEDLQSRLAALGARRAQLIIHPRGPSTYIVVKEPALAAPNKIYVELDLVIENKGNRTSNVNNFGLEIKGTDKHFPELRPSYPQDVSGRRSVYLLSGQGLGIDGHITVEAEKMSSRGKLGFFVTFVPEGDRKSVQAFAAIDCILTIADTEGVTASHNFRLEER